MAKSTPEGRARSNANLRPIALTERTPEEQKAIRRKGQAAQQASLRRKKALRDICTELLGMTCPKGAANLGELTNAAKEAAEGRGQPLDVYEAALLAQLARALQGDTRAAEFVRDSAGDKPGEVVQSAGEPITAADLELLRKVSARLAGGENE